jgi:hypothetical protein
MSVVMAVRLDDGLKHVWYQDGTTDSEGRVVGTALFCDCGAHLASETPPSYEMEG